MEMTAENKEEDHQEKKQKVQFLGVDSEENM